MLLRVENVSKTYLPPSSLLRPLLRTADTGAVEALRSVSFDVAAGEAVGLVGPNGSGKTTLLRIISTLLDATRGLVSVAGFDTASAPAEVRRRLGVVLDSDRGHYHRLTGRANLEFFAALGGLPPTMARQRAGELLDLVGLSDRDKLVFGYSAGMRSRLCLARALITDPPLLVLDEPTRSLDVSAGRQFVELVRARTIDGGSVLLSSHRLDEVASACSRVVVLTAGSVRYDGPTAGLSTTPGGAAAALTALSMAEGPG